MRVAHGTLLLLASLAGCDRQGAPPVAPVESTSDSDGGASSSPLVVNAPPPPGRDRCTARLRASTVKTNPGCQLDERISHGNGQLYFPCAGDGAVEAVFGEHHFEGRVSEGTLALALTTELDWEDGCHWETRQAIRGDWRRDGKRSKLAWTYTERPVSGTSCFGTCKASADIEVDDVSQ